MIKYCVRLPFYIIYRGCRCFIDYNNENRIVITITECNNIKYKDKKTENILIEKIFSYLLQEGFVIDTDELE